MKAVQFMRNSGCSQESIAKLQSGKFCAPTADCVREVKLKLADAISSSRKSAAVIDSTAVSACETANNGSAILGQTSGGGKQREREGGGGGKQWEEGSESLPSGWGRRMAGRQEFILAPHGGHQYKSRLSAFKDMVSKGYSAEEKQQMKAKLVEFEGW